MKRWNFYLIGSVFAGFLGGILGGLLAFSLLARQAGPALAELSTPTAQAAPTTMETPAPSATPTTPGVVARPFFVDIPQVKSIVVDGAVSDWQIEPLFDFNDETDIVYRAHEEVVWNGHDDLSAQLWVGWSEQGLYLAANVTDDVIIQEWSGVNLWQGDYVELQLDTQLKEDFDSTTLSEDDFQIGFTPGDFSATHPPEVFVWEGPIDGEEQLGKIDLAAVKNDTGYVLEAFIPKELLPLATFDLTGAVGLNVNPSDTDAVELPQKLMMSTSPTRTRTDPTTFGEGAFRKTLQFSGYTWQVNDYPNPDDSYFCRGLRVHPENAWVDEQGYLHLLITQRDGVWTCADVQLISTKFGFGTFQWKLNSRVDNLPPSVALGLFTWPPDNNWGTKEFDIEFSQWNVSKGTRGWYTVYGNTVVDPPPQHAMETSNIPDGQQSTHRFTWQSTSISFWSLDGWRDDANFSNPYETWTYESTANFIPQLPLPVRVNLWLADGVAPPGEIEIIVTEFKHIPSSD